MKSVMWLDYAVIVVYMAITIGVGVFFMKFNKGAADFFKGGNKIPWLVSGLSAFMAGFSAWTFTAASGIAYDHGIIIVLLYVGNACTFLFGYWLFAARWRRSRISSPMEYLSERFDHPTRQTFSYSTVFFDMFMVAVWFFALGEFVSAATQIRIEYVIIVSALIILCYSFMGGLWGVVVTEFIQGIILLPITVILAIVSVQYLGGFSNFISELSKPDINLLKVGGSEYSSWTFLISWSVMVIFGYNTRAHAHRYFSVATEKSAKNISALNFVLFLLGSMIWFIPPMVARVVYPDISQVWSGVAHPQEGAYAVISMTLLPNGMIGIMLAAIFSACMSNVSSFYTLFATIITNDILPTYFKKELDDKKKLFLGRTVILCLGIVVPLMALGMVVSGKSAFSLMLTFNSIISIAYGPPALIGLLTRKTPHWSGLAYFIVALIFGTIGWFGLGWGLEQNVMYVMPLSIVIMFGGNLVTKYLIKEKDIYVENRNKFFKKLDTPIDFAKEVGGSRAEVEATVFGFLAKVTAGIAALSLMFLFLNKGEQTNIVILYSAITFILAAAFLVLSKKKHATE